jgi:heme/copper-type cytochrome/quinol oxidase subunit 2
LLSVFLLASTAKVEIQAIETNTSARVPAQMKTEEVKVNQRDFQARDLFQSPRLSKEVVLLHTDTGFVPKSLVLDTAHVFELTVVNVNSRTKAASFFIDEFGVQQAMPYAETKKVHLIPKQSGKYFVVSPESGFEAHVIVIDSPKER